MKPKRPTGLRCATCGCWYAVVQGIWFVGALCGDYSDLRQLQHPGYNACQGRLVAATDFKPM